MEELPGNYRSRYRRDGFGMFIVMETEPGVGQDPDVVGTFNFLLVDREDPILMDLVDHMRNDQGDTDEDLFESGAVTVFNRADGLLRAERNYEVDGVPVRATIEQVSTVAY